MVQLRRWLDRVRLRWDLSVLQKQGKWGDNDETVEYLLSLLTPHRLASITLADLKHTSFFCLSVNVDVLVQMVERARWIMHELTEVYREPTFQQNPLLRTLDEYLVSTLDKPIRAEDAVARLKEELVPMTMQLQLLEADGHPHADYYRRQYSGLYKEVRALLQALVIASNPQMTF